MTPEERAKQWYRENESALVSELETRAAVILTVRSLIEVAVEDEREACALKCDEDHAYYRKMIPNMQGDSIVWHHGAAKAAAHLAREIRAQGKEKKQ